MEIEIIEESKNKMILKIHGEDYTFCNLLKEELLKNKDVEIATFNIAHPLTRIPQFILETNGKTAPKDALIKASKDMKKELEKFGKVFDKAI